MPVRLNRSSADFDERFARFLAAKREISADVEAAARAIVQDVAARGDAGLIEATRKFDRLDLDAARLRVNAADGNLNPLVLAAAHLGGVSEIYRVGGAQAIAALAYGTATIAPVAKIVGPGNAYVAAA